MSKRNFAVLAGAVLLCFSTALAQEKGLLKPPMTKEEERLKYHEPPVKGSSAAIRMNGYKQRLQMEKEAPFANVKWRSIGSEIQGGRVIDIQVPKSEPMTMYCAYATGGLWRSEDMGVTWTSLFDNESSYAIGSVAVTDDGKTLWVGTGENNSSRTSYSGTGVFKSSDRGQTWQHMGLEETHRIGRVLIDPKNPNTVYVGALGALYSNNANRGVYKTTDGGKTWTHSLKLNETTGVIDMVMDPRNPQVLYAASWDRDRRAWNFREGGPGTAIYKTVDGGKTWNKLAGGLPATGDMGRIGLGISPTKPDVVYAYIDDQSRDPETIYKDEYQASGILTARRFKLLNEEQFASIDRRILTRFFTTYMPQGARVDDVVQAVKDKKMTLDDVSNEMLKRNPNVFNEDIVDSVLYRTDDAGKTWRKTHTGTLGEHLGYYCGRVFVSPHNPDDLFTTGTFMLRSQDGGKTFDVIARQVHVDFHAYWIDPTNPNHHAVGNDGGLYISFDNGRNWRHCDSMAVGQYTTLALDDKTPYNVYGGLQDNGTMKGPSTYAFGRNDIWDWTSIGGGDGSAIAVDPRDGGDIVYGASQFGAHYGLNQKTNERWQIRPRTQGAQLRFNWISPILISPHHPDILYLGSQMLHRSLDKGRTWETISGDLTKNLPNGDVPFSTLKDISESPLKFGLIYVGADDGSVKVTKDHGTTWEDISTPVKDRWVMRVLASKWDRATVYCVQNGYRQDDWTPYLWKSTDYGKTWTSIASNLPPEPINVLREDPKNKNMMYVGTDLGVFVTYDGGSKWEPLSGGLPRTPVHDLQIQSRMDELVIGTHARSVWILSLAPIYETTPELRATDMKIWDVSSLTRNERWVFSPRPDYDKTGLPVPPTVRGRYWVKEGGKGTLKVKDKDGKVVKEKELTAVNGYNFFDFDVLLKPGKRGIADPKNRKITSAEEALKDPYAEERPEYLPNGEYTIEITVGNVTKTTKFSISG